MILSVGRSGEDPRQEGPGRAGPWLGEEEAHIKEHQSLSPKGLGLGSQTGVGVA